MRCYVISETSICCICHLSLNSDVSSDLKLAIQSNPIRVLFTPSDVFSNLEPSLYFTFGTCLSPAQGIAWTHQVQAELLHSRTCPSWGLGYIASLGWPQTQRPPASPPMLGLKGVYHHAWLLCISDCNPLFCLLRTNTLQSSLASFPIHNQHVL